jgi:hypothetical protein
MRVIKQNSPGDALNRGVVVFHAGANIARQWSDFREFSEADQDYFEQLLPLEGIEPADPGAAREIVPSPREASGGVEIRAQSDVRVEEIPLLQNSAAVDALRVLHRLGVTPHDLVVAYTQLQPVPTTKVRERQAKRASVDVRIKTEAAKAIKQRGLNPEGRDLDRQRLGRTNLIIVKSAIDRHVNALVGKGARQRSELSRADLDEIESRFPELLASAIAEVFDG